MCFLGDYYDDMQSKINLNLIKDSSEKKKLTFLIILGKRMLNNYTHFFNITNFGNPKILELINENAIRYLLFDEYNENLLQDLKIELDKMGPDSEEFGFVETTYALDCCCIFYDILEFLINKDHENSIIRGSGLSENTVYVFIEEQLSNDNKECTDEIIYSHELMKKEISFQNRIINTIAGTKDEEIYNLLKIDYGNCINI